MTTLNAAAPLRAEHLRLAQEAHELRDLVLAGAFADPVDGAALLFRTLDPNVPSRFAERDPFVRAGLVVAWRVRPWTVVIGSV